MLSEVERRGKEGVGEQEGSLVPQICEPRRCRSKRDETVTESMLEICEVRAADAAHRNHRCEEEK
jgi:hypothetical protein